MKQMDAWVLWDKWMQALRVFIEHGAKIDTTLARIVSEGLKDVGSQYRSKRRMWKVLQQSIHSGENKIYSPGEIILLSGGSCGKVTILRTVMVVIVVVKANCRPRG